MTKVGRFSPEGYYVISKRISTHNLMRANRMLVNTYKPPPIMINTPIAKQTKTVAYSNSHVPTMFHLVFSHFFPPVKDELHHKGVVNEVFRSFIFVVNRQKLHSQSVFLTKMHCVLIRPDLESSLFAKSSKSCIITFLSCLPSSHFSFTVFVGT